MKIKDLLNLSDPFWKYAATDKNGEIYFYNAKPRICNNSWGFADENDIAIRIDNKFNELFDIEPFDGDWKDSLICREECGLCTY